MSDDKRSRLNIKIVDDQGTLSITCKPKRDKAWHADLPPTHAKERGTVLINESGRTSFEERVRHRYAIESTPLVYRLFIQRPAIPRALRWEIVPEPIRTNAFDFQRSDIESAVRDHGGRCFLAHDMGCGKTMISLGIVAQYRSPESRHLVICPSYLRSSWWNEISRWMGLDARVVFKTKDDLTSNPFVVISYDLAVRKLREIQGVHWTTITCDESHYLKSRAAKRTKFLSPILHKCPHVLLLSGTPALSRPCELFTQLQILYPKSFKQFSLFARRYCDLKKTVWGWDSSGSTNPDELSVVLAKCMLRRLKRDVLKDLPRKMRKRVRVPLSRKESKELQEHFVKLRELNCLLSKVTVASQESRNKAFERQSLVSEMFRATARAKLKGVCDYVKGVCQDNAHKIILFGFHQITMNALEELVSNQLKERFIRIDGKTPQLERQSLVDEFQDPNGARIAVLSIGACNSGITLTSCHYTIFCELTWTPSLMQ
tara:strand:- start:875 stop:2335 length:1461 start_codon:yes stop_codon:yes gene_type:complete